MELKNYKELAVRHVLPNIIKTFPDSCTCDKCLLDIQAIALNELKPQYVVTDSGEVYAHVKEMDIQYEANIIKAILSGITQVAEKPQHDE